MGGRLAVRATFAACRRSSPAPGFAGSLGGCRLLGVFPPVAFRFAAGAVSVSLSLSPLSPSLAAAGWPCLFSQLLTLSLRV